MQNEAEEFPQEIIDETKSHKGGVLSFIKEIAQFVFFAVIIVVPIRVFIAQPYIVSGASMDPTFQSGNYLIVDQLSYRFTEPERGEVIIFRYPVDPSKFFIKRVIGLPLETIRIENGDVAIVNETNPDGIHIEEPYKKEAFTATMTVTLKADEYFVMGDNRNESLDSRIWGPLPKDLIVGRALVRLFPFSETAVFPGFAAY